MSEQIQAVPKRNPYVIIFIVGVLGVVILVGALLLLFRDRFMRQDEATNEPSTTEAITYEKNSLPEAPVIQDITRDNYEKQPVYIFLFTHTEDQFNHELSEERYTRIGPILETLQEEYPQQDITWTIEFLGADAQTVGERNAQTGVADYLKSLNQQGLVEFGYHGYHDPTYTNRPQNNLTENSSWQDIYDAMYTWVTCEKDPVRGGCVNDTGGGILAVQKYFGEVQIVTGVGVGDGFQVERSAGKEAIRSVLPDRVMSFGFPDHGSLIRNPDYIESRDSLLEILTPTAETSSSIFWMDNNIRSNDGIPLDNLSSITLRDGPKEVIETMNGIDRTRPNVIHAGIADKFLYTAEGASPTVYGYAHPNNPQLPSSMLLSDVEKNKQYQQTEQALNYLFETFLAENTNSKLVSSDDIADLVITDDYLQLNEDELSSLAAWLVQNWNEQPPNYAYDGANFYSLSDSFALLATSLNGEDVNFDTISTWYGPWDMSRNQTQETMVSKKDLLNSMSHIGNGPEIVESYSIGGKEFTTGQVLYVLAYSYLLEHDSQFADWTYITIPALKSVPETLTYLENVGCINCYDSAWSLKPARIREGR